MGFSAHLEPSKRLIASFKAFSLILEMFKPNSLAFLTSSGGSVMLIVAFFPLIFMFTPAYTGRILCGVYT